MRGVSGFYSNCLVLHGSGVQGVVVLAKGGFRTDKALLYLYQIKTRQLTPCALLRSQNQEGLIMLSERL